MAWDENQGIVVQPSQDAWHEDQGIPVSTPAEIGQRVVAGRMSAEDTAKFLAENPDLAGWEPGGAKINAARQGRIDTSAVPAGVDTVSDTSAAPELPAVIPPLPDLSPKNAVQRAYANTRSVLAYPAAGLTSSLAKAASLMSRHYEGTPEPPSFSEIYKETREAGAKGEGVTGFLSDPIMMAAMATQLIPGIDIPGAAWLATKVPRLAQAAAAYPRATSIARAATTGAAQGAAWSGAQNLMDPNLQYTPLGESMAVGALFGGAAGAAGRGLQEFGLGRIPGVNALYNRSVPLAAKELVKDNAENIFRQGLLPKGRDGLMQASMRRQAALGEKYEEAIEAVAKAHPDMLIPTADWAKGAHDQLVGDLSRWGRAGLVEAPGTKLGFKLPQAATDRLDEQFARVRGTKLGNVQDEVKSIHDLVDFGNKHFPYDPSMPANRSAAQAKLARAWSQDEAIPALAKAPSTAVQVRVDLKDPVKSQLPSMIDDIVNSYRSPQAAKLGPAASKRMHDWISKDLTPKQLSELRTALSDPSMYKDPIAEVAILKRDIGQAIHQAANDRLMLIPEYKAVMGEAVKQNSRIFKEGSVPQKYKLEMSLQNIIDHPGSIGLSDRLNILGLFNPAVSPWLKATTAYKGGGLIRALGLQPLMSDEARQAYDVLRNKP